MGHTGPAPDVPRALIESNGPLPESLRISSDGWWWVIDKPNRKRPLVDLPKTRGNRPDDDGVEAPVEWHAEAVAFWETLRKLPHTTHWRKEEWQKAIEAVHLAHIAFSSDNVSAFAKLDIWQARLGYTPEGRRQNRILYVTEDVYQKHHPNATAAAAAPDAPSGKQRKAPASRAEMRKKG